jgi:carbon storage regulator CsrA
MLVISRRPEQSLLFPALGIRVQVLRIQGNAVRLGVEAPPEIQVLRDELYPGQLPIANNDLDRRAATHELCNRLNKVTLSLHLVSRLWNSRQTEQATELLENTLAELQKLDREWLHQHFNAPREAKPSQRCRALLVDDEQNERELLAGLLRMHGCECDTACNGQDALIYLANKQRPDLILVDMWMPKCDGAATVKAIRTNPRLRGMKVFSISPTPPQDFGLSVGPLGVDEWFPKPINPRKLCDAIQKAMLMPPGSN